MLEYLSNCQFSPHRGVQLAWGREGACISQKLELLADKPSFKPPSRHVSQRQIEDYGVGLIAPQTPQKLTN